MFAKQASAASSAAAPNPEAVPEPGSLIARLLGTAAQEEKPAEQCEEELQEEPKLASQPPTPTEPEEDQPPTPTEIYEEEEEEEEEKAS